MCVWVGGCGALIIIGGWEGKVNTFLMGEKETTL